jgi:integrase
VAYKGVGQEFSRGSAGQGVALRGHDRKSQQTSAAAIVNLFAVWYRALGFNGCSSHSGRRGFITNAARKIGTVGGSLRDVRLLAGHASLSTTQRYIEAHADAQRRIVELV